MTSISIILQVLVITVLCTALNGFPIEPRFPTFWLIAPSSISDYPMNGSCSSVSLGKTNYFSCRLIDPWIYTDRLGLYKILISATRPLMSFCSISLLQECNILFSLATQLSWQFDSNRLFSNGTQNISTDSWWGSFSYYLSVIPFLAAVDTGILHLEPFQIAQRDIFCSNLEQCFEQMPEVMSNWRLFFTELSNSSRCAVDSDSNANKLIDHCYLRPLSFVQNISITYSLLIIQPKLHLLPSENEQYFALGWANVLILIGMARKHTDLLTWNTYQDDYLPSRMLRDDDHLPFVPDLPHSVNLALELLFAVSIDDYPSIRFQWSQVTCTFVVRQYAQIIVDVIPLSKSIAAFYYADAVAEVLLYGCDDS